MANHRELNTTTTACNKKPRALLAVNRQIWYNLCRGMKTTLHSIARNALKMRVERAVSCGGGGKPNCDRGRVRSPLRRVSRDSRVRLRLAQNQGTEGTEETQGTFPLAAIPSYVVSCVLPPENSQLLNNQEIEKEPENEKTSTCRICRASG